MKNNERKMIEVEFCDTDRNLFLQVRGKKDIIKILENRLALYALVAGTDDTESKNFTCVSKTEGMERVSLKITSIIGRLGLRHALRFLEAEKLISKSTGKELGKRVLSRSASNLSIFNNPKDNTKQSTRKISKGCQIL